MEKLQNQIKYSFKNKDLLVQALTHPSMNQKNNYERLEFLGDSVLNLIISEYLIDSKQEREGVLASNRSYLISGNVICNIAQTINIGDYLLLAKSEIKSGGSTNPSNLENALEAIIGAIFMDSNYETTKEIVLELWSDHLDVEINKYDLNPKSFLQEWSSQYYHILPIYRIINQSGPDHNRIFTVEVEINGFDKAHGNGASLKKAEINAAKILIQKIHGQKI